ncbi:MAG: adenylyltransferase/cytidyltransferase family protein [Candidatus Micrarchaeota archaeon]|nr:adenylyltransferase/cytidyltransferase family protein [Candidatus Micrarchaeota archaeon]
MNKNIIKKIYLLQIKWSGIPQSIYNDLIDEEKFLLEKSSDRYFLKTENRKLITIVQVGGAFDVLHLGHVYTLNEAKKHGDVLVVTIATDELVKKKKGKLIHTQDYRAKMVEQLKSVDLVLIGVETPEKTYEKVKPDVIVYGYDQKPFLQPEGVKIIQLTEHFEQDKFKTSKIIKELGL